MTILAITAFLLVGQPKGDVIWSPTVSFALAWARRVGKPVLAAGMGFQRGVGYLSDTSYDDVLSGFVPVEVSTYSELTKVSKNAPPTGTPQIVVLDSNGKLLKRFGGFAVRPRDLGLLKIQIDWVQTEGQEILRNASRPDADADTYADAATILAMRADTKEAIQKLSVAINRRAKPEKVVAAWEALADDARVSGDLDGIVQCIRYYRAALSSGPVTDAESRIRCRLASALWRAGDVPSALEQTRIVLSNSTFPSEDQERARRLQDRIQGG